MVVQILHRKIDEKKSLKISGLAKCFVSGLLHAYLSALFAIFRFEGHSVCLLLICLHFHVSWVFLYLNYKFEVQ